ncbi:hypothetical protein [Pandoraea pnomenusa]|uniref:hypothetical protein n=1 Tax=Pandoraea pnomenusa TaxID=93220 RepID=UPI001AC189EB|nr:hypothetical protein [Pandoraea pnomenusa]MBN9093909.1 hypothetical protein [Pandoraea pnomenusa]
MSTSDNRTLANAGQTLAAQSNSLGNTTGMFKMPDGNTFTPPSLAGLSGIQSGMVSPQPQIDSTGLFSSPTGSPALGKAALAAGMSLGQFSASGQGAPSMGGRGGGALPAVSFGAPIGAASGATTGNPQLLAFLQSMKLGGGR